MIPALHMASRDALAERHWPDGMAFDAEHETLLRRGWPALRIFGPDEPKPEAIAKKHLAAIDPTRFVVWPREAARLYVRAFARGTGATIDPKDRSEVDVATLDAVLGRMRTLGYVFLMRDALLLSEAFLGSAIAADRALAALEGLSRSTDGDRPASWAIVVVGCLELFVMRADDAALHDDAESRLRALATKHRGTLLGHRCRLTVEGPAVHREVGAQFHYDVEHLRIDEGTIDAYLAHEFADWLYTPQIARMFGPARAPAKLTAAAKRVPAWKQEERALVFAPIRHAFVGQMMAGMIGSKGAKGLPETWLAAHPELAPKGTGPVDPAKAKKAAKRPSAKTVDRAVVAALTALGKTITKIRGDAEKEKVAITTCVHAIVEVRAASGEAIPNAHVGHVLMLDGWAGVPAPLGALEATAAELDRWAAFIDEASGS